MGRCVDDIIANIVDRYGRTKEIDGDQCTFAKVVVAIVFTV